MTKNNPYIVFILLLFIGCKADVPTKNNNAILLDSLKQVAKELYIKEDAKFTNSNRTYLSLALKNKDSLHMANALWNFGNQYAKLETNDSAYYYFNASYKLYNALHENVTASKLQYNKAAIQKKLRDYTGAEINTYRALDLLGTDEIKLQILNRNLLGVIYQKLNENQESISQFKNALKLIQRSGEYKILEKSIYNNIGLVYQQSKDYDLAILYFNKALELITADNQESYARYTNNINYTLFLQGNLSPEVEQGLLDALKIREDLNLKSGITDSYMKLSEYYKSLNNEEKAIDYANKSLNLAKSIQYLEAELKAYTQLSEIDHNQAHQYFTISNQIRDSLDKADRAIRNKFTRIEYETDTYIEKTQKLATTNIYLSFLSGLLVVISLLIYNIVRQRSKNKQFQLQNELDQDKIEMYMLSVKSQEKFEEGKYEERKRISMDLHDGVLSALTSIRLSLNVLDKKLTKQNVEAVVPHDYIDEISKVEKEIRQISHNLYNQNMYSYNFTEILKDNITSVGKLKVKIIQVDSIHWNLFDDKLKSNLLRILKEAYKNTLVHANASLFTISIKHQSKILSVEIKDNGVGYNTKKPAKGIGILNIKKRVETILNGQLKIVSNAKGTLIQIKLPQNS